MRVNKLTRRLFRVNIYEEVELDLSKKQILHELRRTAANFTGHTKQFKAKIPDMPMNKSFISTFLYFSPKCIQVMDLSGSFLSLQQFAPLTEICRKQTQLKLVKFPMLSIETPVKKGNAKRVGKDTSNGERGQQTIITPFKAVLTYYGSTKGGLRRQITIHLDRNGKTGTPLECFMALLDSLDSGYSCLAANLDGQCAYQAGCIATFFRIDDMSGPGSVCIPRLVFQNMEFHLIGRSELEIFEKTSVQVLGFIDSRYIEVALDYFKAPNSNIKDLIIDGLAVRRVFKDSSQPLFDFLSSIPPIENFTLHVDSRTFSEDFIARFDAIIAMLDQCVSWNVRLPHEQLGIAHYKAIVTKMRHLKKIGLGIDDMWMLVHYDYNRQKRNVIAKLDEILPTLADLPDLEQLEILFQQRTRDELSFDPDDEYIRSTANSLGRYAREAGWDSLKYITLTERSRYDSRVFDRSSLNPERIFELMHDSEEWNEVQR
jgi:hypothetical protein